MSGFDYNNDNILSNFPSCLRKNIEELCLRSKIGKYIFRISLPTKVLTLITNLAGLSNISLADISLIQNKICTNEEDNLEHYHFIIKVPYAGKRLKWEIIFDPEDFDFAPDFHFNDEHFLENPDFEIIQNNIPSLVNWNLRNHKMLSQVLNEFISLYKKLQVSCSQHIIQVLTE